ncbi:MAG TPA: DUF6448 family protein [Steroidobacteraceae bacterium]|jgi:uncharacterized protein DUF6448|nr:DUF6448 family protein [Steroidobacteraceae bacterium]
MKAQRIERLAVAAVLVLAACIVSLQASAHCDSVAGPVVQDARAALEQGDPTAVLKWVRKEHEQEIRSVFRQTMVVRAKGDDAKALADQHFFETLVRVHRAGEGEAFSGLKPASATDEGIAAADRALQLRSGAELSKSMSAAVAEGIRARFALALERKQHAASSIEAGRDYVEAYVDYIHFVEAVNRLASHGASHAHQEQAGAPEQ